MTDRQPPPMSDMQKELANQWPRPPVGTPVLWKGAWCRVVETPAWFTAIQVRVQRRDETYTMASTVHLIRGDGVGGSMPWRAEPNPDREWQRERSRGTRNSED